MLLSAGLNVCCMLMSYCIMFIMTVILSTVQKMLNMLCDCLQMTSSETRNTYLFLKIDHAIRNNILKTPQLHTKQTCIT